MYRTRVHRGTGLADLERPGCQPGLDCTARRGHPSADRVRELLDQLPTRGVASGAAGDDHVRGRQAHLGDAGLTIDDLHS